jgi:hypothetical protein
MQASEPPLILVLHIGGVAVATTIRVSVFSPGDILDRSKCDASVCPCHPDKLELTYTSR